MAISPDKFWGINYYKNPPLTDAMIALAERQLGVRLPRQYVELLRIQNGGYTEQELAFPLVAGAARLQDCISLEALAGIVPESDIASGGAHNILITEYMTQEWGLPPRQVLLAGDGHTWVSLDYRGGDEPTVVWLDTEMETETFVARTFDEFFAGLRPASELDD